MVAKLRRYDGEVVATETVRAHYDRGEVARWMINRYLRTSDIARPTVELLDGSRYYGYLAMTVTFARL